MSTGVNEPADNAQPSNARQYDVLIVGGGIVGLTLACELAGSDFSVAVIERQPPRTVSDTPKCRVSAINRFAIRQYEQCGAWQPPLNARAGAFEKMTVWDYQGAGQISFDSAELGLPALGVIIENNVLQQMLYAAAQQADNIQLLCPQEIESIRYQGDAGELPSVMLASGETLVTELLVGADGVNSRVREAAMIPRSRKSYQQQALVCNVSTSESHENTAWQCFLPGGPLAFLPMFNGQSSIVWSLDDALAEEKMILSEADFKAALAEAFEYRLGEITAVGPRYLFPLSHGHARDYVKPRLALVGDAAHNIHPLAGQGANLGIADAAALAQVIKDARAKGRQWWAEHTLKKYQRRRKGANQLMELSMTGFKQLFGNDNALLAEIRNAGLTLVDHLPALKYRLIKQALGE